MVNITARFATGLTFWTHSFHVGAPELEITSVVGLPAFVQVEDEVGPTLPVPVMRMHCEVGVDIQKAAASRLVQPSSFE